MATTMPIRVIKRPVETTRRKRISHTKSRLGCRNCKLRRVKCDETKPTCGNCVSFEVSCNYDSRTPDLQVRTGSAACIDALDQFGLSINVMMRGMINVSLNRDRVAELENNEMFQLDSEDLERLGRFQTRTVLTFGTPISAQVYQKEVIKLACVHPYLMHSVHTITAIHDRYLSASASAKRTMTETYHWAQAAAMVNEKLSMPIQPCDRDALWAAALLFGVIAFASIEASRPEEAWPLKSASSDDLEWLRMSYGKKAVWEHVDPLRNGGVFHEIVDHIKQEYLLPLAPKPAPKFLLSAFVDLCNLDSSSDLEKNPYYAAVQSLAPLLDVECNESTILRFLSYISYMNSEFKYLLEEKDPRAMLLLAYWYAKVCRSHWWVARRAMLEGQATCIYLERYHGDYAAIQELLRFPKMKLGLIT
jgi:hypothetical protein